MYYGFAVGTAGCPPAKLGNCGSALNSILSVVEACKMRADVLEI